MHQIEIFLCKFTSIYRYFWYKSIILLLFTWQI